MQESNTTVSLYVVKGVNGSYFAGFDTSKGQANFVEDPKAAKKFTNKHDIKLRPDEHLVELAIDLAVVAVKISEPFRPQRRVKPQ
jgi:aconitase A